MKLETLIDRLADYLHRPADLEIHLARRSPADAPEAAVLYLGSITKGADIRRKLLVPIMAAVASPAVAGRPLKESSELGELLLEAKPVSLELPELAKALFAGYGLALIRSMSEALAIEAVEWNNRAVTQPERESSLIGPRDAFIEDIGINLSMIRRRVRHPELTVEERFLGESSQTKIMIVSMANLVNENALRTFCKRLDGIRIDQLLDSSQLAYLISHERYTPFPMFQATERPDKAVSALMEGRFLVLVDTTPSVLVLPATMNSLFETPDDYYFSSLMGTYLRWVRLTGLAITLFLPALYIAITSVNQDMFRVQFMLAVAASREGVPYPAYVEVVIMLLLIELINEATVRLPKTIGGTATIVGGLIIGTAAAQAHLISYIMIVVTATTAIGSYTVPNYTVGLAWRLFSLVIVLLAIPWGLYGIVLGASFTGLYLSSLNSLGVPYTAPFGTGYFRDLFRDALMRAPHSLMKFRPFTYSFRAGGTRRLRLNDEEDML